MYLDFSKLERFREKYPHIAITIQEFIFVNALASDEQISMDYCAGLIDEKTFAQLQEKGIIKLTESSTSIRSLGLELVGESTVDEVLKTAREIREIFPAGVKSGGYLVRSSEKDIADKLRKFLKKHKFSCDEILRATKLYVERKRANGWAFMQTAVYFIEKNGVSNLASECENLSNVDDSPEISFTHRL